MKSVNERLSAVQRLAEAPPAERFDRLTRALTDRSNLVVAEAAKGLAKLLDPRAIAPLTEAYGRFVREGPRKDPGCTGKWHIVTALAEIISESGVTPHAPVVPDAPFRSAADVFLHAITVSQIEPSGPGMQESAVGLRGQAALALAQTGTEGALLPISLLLFDMRPPAELPVAPTEEPFVTLLARRSAARAIGVLGDPAGVPLLGIKLAYPEGELPELLVECMDALATLDAEAAMRLIPPYLSRGEKSEAASQLYLTAGAATALASLPEAYHPRVVDLLIDACRQTMAADVQEALAFAVASMRSDWALEGLKRMASDEAVPVRLAAVAALELRRGEAAYQLLQEIAAHDDDRRVVEAAQEALKLS